MYKISEVEIILLIVSNIRDNFLPNLHFCCYIQENMDLRKYSSISRYFLPFFHLDYLGLRVEQHTQCCTLRNVLIYP